MEHRLAELRDGGASINSSPIPGAGVLRAKRGALNFDNFPDNKWDMQHSIKYMFAPNMSKHLHA